MKKKLTPVIIAQKAKTPKAVALTETLRQSIESKLIQIAPSLEKRPKLARSIINTIVNMVKVYLPEYSEKEILDAGPEKLKKITNRATEAYKHAVVDALIFPIADELNARNIALSGDAVGKIIDNLTPNIVNIQQEKDLITILDTPKKERFPPKKYTGAKEVPLDQVDGGLPILFLPEKTKELILRALTHPIRSSLTEDPESALSLPSDNEK